MRGERGATTIEYVGVIVVVAAIVAVVAVAPLRARLGSGLSTAMCQIMGHSGCPSDSVATGPSSEVPAPGSPGSGTPGSGTPGSGTPGTSGDGSPGGPTIDQGPPLQISVTDGPDSCDGFLDCAGSALASAGEGAWTGLRDEAKGTWDLITNPSQIADAGKAIWDNPWDSVRQLVWDDESAQMADDGNTAGAAGRTGWNLGSWLVPGIDLLKVSKITKLSKIAKLAETAEKIAGLTKKAETAATKAEKAATTGNKAAADAAAKDSRKAAQDARDEANRLGCPLALPGPARLGGGSARGLPASTVLTLAPAALLASGTCDDATAKAQAAEKAAQRAEDVAAGKLFPNTMPELRQQELAEAAKLGVKPMKVGDPGFEAVVNAGTVKWAVLEDGTLVVVPKHVGGVEIKHSVLSGGNPVRAAGEAEIAGAGGQYFGAAIDNSSGHFLPSSESVKVGQEAFAEAGISFP